MVCLELREKAMGRRKIKQNKRGAAIVLPNVIA
jgi:hypothetical protein